MVYGIAPRCDLDRVRNGRSVNVCAHKHTSKRNNNMARTNEELYEELGAIKTMLQIHINTEEPVINAAQKMLDVHGEDHEVIRARIAFVNQWMKREAKREEARDALRKAIIEKGTILALLALVTYLFGLVSEDVRQMFAGAAHK